MKKLFIVLALFVLCACGKSETVQMSEINSFAVDMSGYNGMSSVNHQFKGVTPQDFMDLVKNGGSGLFYIGYESCPICNDAISIINRAAEELNLTVYYIDAYEENYPLIDVYDEFVEVVRPILKERNGEPILYTPHVLTVVNGEFKDNIIGLEGIDITVEKDVDKAVNSYKKLMRYFVEE